MDSNLDLVSVKIQNGWEKKCITFLNFSLCCTFHIYNIFIVTAFPYRYSHCFKILAYSNEDHFPFQ